MHSIPEAKVSASCCMVVAHSIIWVGDPEGCWCDVIILERCRGDHKDGTIVLEGVTWKW